MRILNPGFRGVRAAKFSGVTGIAVCRRLPVDGSRPFDYFDGFSAWSRRGGLPGEAAP
ncbi:Uncharacterised protein [Amycolatopsis camponoti]|uniref:Uncharacterized protein n=1 Tax=Amycolatopsis camponoti TaxID=2606593 RepID=A0A6I8M066_9PSEU|nr:Uncharacterised protein [Amycolatopsis camponoti]